MRIAMPFARRGSARRSVPTHPLLTAPDAPAATARPRRRTGVRGPLVLLVAAGLAGPVAPAQAATKGGDDVTVIAVIDGSFSPYHWDFAASQMPQALNRDRSDDLPLNKAPDKWLAGFPSRKAFKDYRPLNLTLSSRDDAASPAALYQNDSAKWDSVKGSTGSEVNYYWLPGTKVIGAMSFGGGRIYGGSNTAHTNAHGTGTASVSVGNLHGTCPECVLLFIQYVGAANGEAAINWAMKQPWIDAISNSYGFSNDGATRSRIYDGSNTELQREASLRGQTIFFSAGNGLENGFTVPNTTLKSSQEGPDWITTVTASDPNGGNYTGTGKPGDVAGIGSDYPSAYNSTSVTTSGNFSGTSNATPMLAGYYGRALYFARRAVPGRSRMQSRGVIAQGSLRCGSARRDCEFADGKLTGTELRMRLLRSAVSTGQGFTGGLVSTPPSPRVADSYFAAEGHGTYFGRLKGDDLWRTEFDRLFKPLVGTAAAPNRPAGEKEWFLVDSWCRQLIWGEWSEGYYKKGRDTLPSRDVVNWPTRSAIQDACPALADSSG